MKNEKWRKKTQLYLKCRVGLTLGSITTEKTPEIAFSDRDTIGLQSAAASNIFFKKVRAFVEAAKIRVMLVFLIKIPVSGVNVPHPVSNRYYIFLWVRCGGDTHPNQMSPDTGVPRK